MKQKSTYAKLGLFQSVLNKLRQQLNWNAETTSLVELLWLCPGKLWGSLPVSLGMCSLQKAVAELWHLKYLAQWVSTVWPHGPEGWRGGRPHTLDPTWGQCVGMIQCADPPCTPAQSACGLTSFIRSSFAATVWCVGPYHVSFRASHKSGILAAREWWQH